MTSTHVHVARRLAELESRISKALVSLDRGDVERAKDELRGVRHAREQ